MNENDRFRVDDEGAAAYKQHPSTPLAQTGGRSVSENWIVSEECWVLCTEELLIHRTALPNHPRGTASDLGGSEVGFKTFYGEFDPGSERTLAAGLTTVSRARKSPRPRVQAWRGEEDVGNLPLSWGQRSATNVNTG